MSTMSIHQKIEIAHPILGRDEENAILGVMRSGNLSSGKKVEEFEFFFAQYIGTKYAVAVTNGSIALYLSLLALGIGNGDEVITSSFSFIAAVNAILMVGAVPVFADINDRTFNLDPELILNKISPKTKAIIPVHLYGLPAEMDAISKIAKKHNLYVIEDACQAHGAAIKNRKAGSIGNVGCFSFYPTKNMTTGEGGMITTNSKRIAENLLLLRQHGMKKRYYHNFFGFNYRMTDLSAAIGIEQLKKLNTFIEKRIKNARQLSDGLSSVREIILPHTPKNYIHAFHQYTIRVPTKDRKRLQNLLRSKNIATEIYYPIPINKQKVFGGKYNSEKLKFTSEISKEVLSLPVHPLVKRDDIKFIVSTIKEFYEGRI